MTPGSTEEEKDKPRYRLGQFDGPLDLLLFLIRKNEVNIHDIPIAEITVQYLEFLKYSTVVNLEELTEFYLMAATLLCIKSSMLLPVENSMEDEIDDPRQGLVHRLIEYERMRKLTDLMAEREKETDWIVERRKVQAVLPFADESELWDQVGSWDLLRSFSKIINNLGGHQVINLWEEVTINEKVTLLREYLDDRQEFSFDDLVINPGSVLEVISAFLAVLELVKEGLIDVFQNRLFGDIRIKQSKRFMNEEHRHS